MTTYRPYTKEDKLEVGRGVKIAGRVGSVTAQVRTPFTYIVHFTNETPLETGFILNTTLFTDFEIEDTPLPPLTIDKRVKGGIERIIKEWKYPLHHSLDVGVCRDILGYLNSLDEV